MPEGLFFNGHGESVVALRSTAISKSLAIVIAKEGLLTELLTRTFSLGRLDRH